MRGTDTNAGVERHTANEAETRAFGAELASELHAAPPAFVRLIGPLGAGKSAFARGFIARWLELSGHPAPESIVSPTYNIARAYGGLAHLDLYRLKSLRELEQLGYEHYFYELPCCLVEWLEQVPEGPALMPPYAIEVELAPVDASDRRLIKVRNWKTAS